MLGQKDPQNEYKHEGFELFDQMLHSVWPDFIRYVILAVLCRSEDRRLGQTGAEALAAPRTDAARRRSAAAQPPRAPRRQLSIPAPS